MDISLCVRPYLNQEFRAREPFGPEPAALYRLVSGTNASFVPAPITGPANTITTTSANLTGSLIPVGNGTVYWFEYGTDTNYSQTTPTNSVTTSTTQIGLNLGINGLTPLTLYHFQLVVTDDWGTQYGGDQIFTTPGLPPVVVTENPSYNYGCEDCAPYLLSGRINGKGTAITGYFEFGISSYTEFRSPSFFGPANYSDQEFSYYPTNRLSPSTTYHYRIVGFNGVSEGIGGDATFITPP